MNKYENIHIEKDFWDDFIVEAFEHLEEIETNAMSLEKNPEDMDIIHTMFRAFHTIKGLSGFVEHTAIQEVAHKTETLMDFCRKGELKVNTQIVNAILKASDFIKQLCDDVNAFKDDNLIVRIEQLLVVLEELASVGEKPWVEPEAQTSEQPEEPQQEEPQISQDEKLEAFASEFGEMEPAEVEAEAETEAIVEEVVEEIAEEVFEEIAEEIAEEVIEETIEETVEEVVEEVVEEAVAEASCEPALEPEALKTFQSDIMAKLKGNPPEANKEAYTTKHTSANEEYMKVANYKIDHLVEMIGELIINQSLIEQYVATKYAEDRELTTNMSGFLRTTSELQNLSMSLRMVSLKPTFQKIVRIARDTIQELDKNVEFITTGDNTEIDRSVAEKLLDPLVHLIKNAISHGVEETSADRTNINKPARAKVELNAYSKRGKIFIEVKDDGRGINTEIVYQKALEKGLIDPARTYSDAEIKEFILLPGFSTAKVVDNISGRGVGMDVVKTQIFKIGGKVDIDSTLNVGSIFTLEVPINHSVMNGTIVEINKQHFVVPTLNVKEFLQPQDSQWIFTQQKRTMIRVRDNIIPIIPHTVFFKDAKQEEHVPLVMLLELDQELKALPITNVFNRQEVVVKPVGEEFAKLKYISGMSILGTGKVSLILDIDYLFRKEIKE